MEQIASTNGVAKKTPAKKKAEAPKKTTPTSVALPNNQFSKMVEFQQTIEKVEEMKKLTESYDKLTETLNGILSFKGNNAGQSVQFNLQDFTNDKNFTTYNSNLINMVVEILVEKLKVKQEEVIDNILYFKF